MLSIDPAIWAQIEPQIRTLMVASFDAGFDAGSGAPQQIARSPQLTQLLDDTRRHWAAGLASMETWRRAYRLPLPPPPEWITDL